MSNLLASIRRRYARVFKHRFTVERRMGALFLLDQQNFVDKRLLHRGEWERPQMERLFELAEELFPAAVGARHFLDVGAHGGIYAIRFAMTARPDDQVTAVECDPVNLAQLNTNLLLNGLLERVQIWPYAATSNDDVVTLHVAHDNNRGVSRIEASDEISFKGTRTVQGRRLDGLWSGQGQPLIAKIDVEGHEQQALAGMKKMLTTCTGLLQVEIFPKNYDAATAMLNEWGYRTIGSIDGDYYFTNVALQ